jgi:type II secretory pathway predicted ATPase ExeA
MIERLQAHWGFTRTPFGRDLAPSMPHRHSAHREATARITWTINEHALGVITGEVGVGKTVATRAALATLDPSRHIIIYLGNPTVGARGIHHAIVTALGGTPRFHHATLIPQAADALATEHAERGRTPVLVIDEAHLLDHTQLESLRMLTLCRGRGYAGSAARPGGFSLLGGARPPAHLGIITRPVKMLFTPGLLIRRRRQ